MYGSPIRHYNQVYSLHDIRHSLSVCHLNVVRQNILTTSYSKKARSFRAFCILVDLKKLQVETDAKLVDAFFVLAIGGVGGQEVEVDLETGGEDEPAALGTDG